jgi:hypothetical protein
MYLALMIVSLASLLALLLRKFEEPEQFLEGIHDSVNEVQPSQLMCVFHDGIECVQWVIEYDRDYCHESTFWLQNY